MNTLILYETYSSSTELTAQYLQTLLQQAGWLVTLKKAHSAPLSDLESHDLIVFASPSWWVDNKDGQTHIGYYEFFESWRTAHFENKKIAVVGLGDKTYAHFCRAVDYIEKFVAERGGNPIISSLRIDRYFSNEPENQHLIYEWAQQLIYSIPSPDTENINQSVSR